jgi:uncharacterized membrane protein
LRKTQAVWVACYAYIGYLLLSEIPSLSGNPLFSIQANSAILAVLYIVSSFVIWGIGKAGKYLVATFVIAYIIEFIGVTTGAPFGNYSYTSGLTLARGPLIGPIPLFIPLLWCTLGYFSLQASGPSIVAPSILMTLLDVSFDPVFSGNLWTWRATPGPVYFGVPALNFFGWFISSIVIFGVFWLVTTPSNKRRMKDVFYSHGSIAASGFYYLFGLTNVIAELNNNLPTAAAVSAVLFTGAFIVLVLLAKREEVPR